MLRVPCRGGEIEVFVDMHMAVQESRCRTTVGFDQNAAATRMQDAAKFLKKSIRLW